MRRRIKPIWLTLAALAGAAIVAVTMPALIGHPAARADDATPGQLPAAGQTATSPSAAAQPAAAASPAAPSAPSPAAGQTAPATAPASDQANSAPSAAGATTAPAQIDPAVAPYIAASTVGLIRVDLSNVDLDAVDAYIKLQYFRATVVGDSSKSPATQPVDLGKDYETARQFVGDLKAAGVLRGYGIMDVNAANGLGEGVVGVLVMQPGADFPTISALLSTGPLNDTSLHARKVGDVILFGDDDSITLFEKSDKANRQDINDALAAAGDSSLCYVISPPAALRALAAGQFGPNLPPELGGGPTFPITQGFGWLTVAVSAPPQNSATAILQCNSPAGADAWLKMLQAGITDLQTTEFPKQIPQNAKAMADLLTTLTPKEKGTQLISTIAGPDMDAAILAIIRAGNETDHTPADPAQPDAGPPNTTQPATPEPPAPTPPQAPGM